MTTPGLLGEIEARLNREIGLDIGSVGPTAVSMAVAARMKARAIPGLPEYGALLAVSEAELQKLVEEIVVPETWFFRDLHPFLALGDWVLREWLPAHPGGVLRLLSMPCSTGEEPFSLVMALLEAGLEPGQFVVEAVDISGAALERARHGVFGRNSFRGSRLDFRDKYFEKTPEGWRLSEAVRRQVQFRQANVLDASFAVGGGGGGGSREVIFCRNLLIYFDEAAQRHVMESLRKMLSPGGLLFVGHAEAYVACRFGFQAAQMPMAFAFRHAGSAPAPQPGCALRPKAAPPRARPPRARAAVSRSAPAPRPLPPVEPAPPPKPEAALLEARALADAGRFEAAEEKCAAYLEKRGPSSGAYYLLGLIRDAAGRNREADGFYRKALYLEPDHCEALVHLALLVKKGGDADAARQLERRAVRAREKQAKNPI